MFVASGILDEVNGFGWDFVRPDMDDGKIPRQVMDIDNRTRERPLDVKDLAQEVKGSIAMDLAALLHAEEHIELGYIR